MLPRSLASWLLCLTLAFASAMPASLLAQVIRPPVGGTSSGGDVIGPTSADVGELVMYGSTTGKLLTNSGTTITADSTLTGASNVLIPTALAVRTYVDGRVTGIQWKTSVRVATTADGTFASAYENGDTVDGVVLATGDRILLKNQVVATVNGIYTVNASGAPTRATDADTGAEVLNATVLVTAGTANAFTTWTNNNTSAPTLGSTNITFAQMNGANVYTASTGLTLSGSAFAIDSTVATLTGSQTLTNKTLTSPFISTVLGGTGVGSSVTLQATTGAGVGSESIKFLVGNNGAIEAGRIISSGSSGFWGLAGATSPVAPLQIGTGDVQNAGSSTTVAQLLALRRGTNASPDTTQHPLLKVERTVSITSGPSGDGAQEMAAISAVNKSTTTGTFQPIGVYGTAVQAGTGDAGGGYFSGYAANGSGVGIGLWAYGQANSAGNEANGVEAVVANQTGSDLNWNTTTARPAAHAIWINAYGNANSASAITIANSFGRKFDVGIGLISNSGGGVTGTSFYDASLSTTSLRIAGTHTTSIQVDSGGGVVNITPAVTFGTSLTNPLVIGGTAVGSSLTLQSTSGVGSSDSILFKVGNNGATTAGTINTSAAWGIGGSPNATARLLVTNTTASSGTGVAGITVTPNTTHSSGTLGFVYGVNANITAANTGGTVSNTSGLRTVATQNGVGGTTDVLSGLLVSTNVRTNGTVNTNAGIYIADQAGVANGTIGSFQLWSNGTAPSYFAGSIQIGTAQSVSNFDLSLGYSSARSIGVERHATANTAGTPVTLSGGGATSGATDKDGGKNTRKPGVPTGTGRSWMEGQCYTTATATGTSDGTLFTCLAEGVFKALTNNSAGNVVNLTLASDTGNSVRIDYQVEVIDAAHAIQVEDGFVICRAVNSNGSFSLNTCTETSTQSLTTGTLATTWAITGANPAVVSLNANSSLTPATGYPRLRMGKVIGLGHQALAMQ